MEDLYKLPPLTNACNLAEKILCHFQVCRTLVKCKLFPFFTKDVDEAAKLQEVQKAAKKDPLQLVKPVATRWNSVYDSHVRMVCLKSFIL